MSLYLKPSVSFIAALLDSLPSLSTFASLNLGFTWISTGFGGPVTGFGCASLNSQAQGPGDGNPGHGRQRGFMMRCATNVPFAIPELTSREPSGEHTDCRVVSWLVVYAFVFRSQGQEREPQCVGFWPSWGAMTPLPHAGLGAWSFLAGRKPLCNSLSGRRVQVFETSLIVLVDLMGWQVSAPGAGLEWALCGRSSQMLFGT
jgi:hypothetical protein